MLEKREREISIRESRKREKEREKKRDEYGESGVKKMREEVE